MSTGQEMVAAAVVGALAARRLAAAAPQVPTIGYDGPRYVYDRLAVQSSGNTFRTWEEVVTAIAAGQLAPTVVFAQPGQYAIAKSLDLRGGKLASLSPATGQVSVTLGESATLDNLGGLTDGVVLTVKPSTQPALRLPMGGAPAVVLIERGAALRNESTTGMRAFPDVAAGSVLVVAFFTAAQTAVPPSTAPLVRCTGGTLIAPIYGPHASPGDGWATDSTGTSTLVYHCDSTFPEVAPLTPGFNPASVVKFQGSLSRSVAYTPANPADWAWAPTVPTTVGQALDYLAAKP